MKAIITWYDKADRLVKDANDIKKDIASQILSMPTREAQMDFVASRVAPAVATRYKAEVVRTKSGGVSFNKRDGSRDSTALSALRYWCSGTTLFAPSGSAAKNNVRHKSEKDSATRQREFVLKAFNLLSATDRNWVIKHAGI
jgi:hypothetical protein